MNCIILSDNEEPARDIREPSGIIVLLMICCMVHVHVQLVESLL